MRQHLLAQRRTNHGKVVTDQRRLRHQRPYRLPLPPALRQVLEDQHAGPDAGPLRAGADLAALCLRSSFRIAARCCFTLACKEDGRLPRMGRMSTVFGWNCCGGCWCLNDPFIDITCFLNHSHLKHSRRQAWHNQASDIGTLFCFYAETSSIY